VPRSALRPPAARMVASRALGELCRLLRADSPLGGDEGSRGDVPCVRRIARKKATSTTIY
jgi:hypothetical protein